MRKLLNAWRYLGSLLVVLILGIVLYLYFRTPLLINYFEIVSRLKANTIEIYTLELAAAMLPLMFVMVIFLTAFNI